METIHRFEILFVLVAPEQYVARLTRVNYCKHTTRPIDKRVDQIHERE
jgi:hypothetical protein